jgi:hypothetical protein
MNDFGNFSPQCAVISRVAQCFAFSTERFYERDKTMNARRDEVRLAVSNARESAHQRKQRLKLAGAILTLVMILFVTAQWPQRDSNAARLASPQNDGSPAATFVIDYFPAQFDSPAKNGMPEEHIQAF